MVSNNTRCVTGTSLLDHRTALSLRLTMVDMTAVKCGFQSRRTTSIFLVGICPLPRGLRQGSLPNVTAKSSSIDEDGSSGEASNYLGGQNMIPYHNGKSNQPLGHTREGSRGPCFRKPHLHRNPFGIRRGKDNHFLYLSSISLVILRPLFKFQTSRYVRSANPLVNVWCCRFWKTW